MNNTAEEIDQFGGKDILEVLRIYENIFETNQVFKKAADEITRLRKELEKK